MYKIILKAILLFSIPLVYQQNSLCFCFVFKRKKIQIWAFEFPHLVNDNNSALPKILASFHPTGRHSNNAKRLGTAEKNKRQLLDGLWWWVLGKSPRNHRGQPCKLLTAQLGHITQIVEAHATSHHIHYCQYYMIFHDSYLKCCLVC